MEEKYKVILAHPGQQHSYHSAIALGEDLYAYITTNYYKKYKGFTWFASLFASKKLKSRMKKRRCEAIDDKTLTFCEIRSLLSNLQIQKKFPRFRKIVDYYDSFGRKVAEIAVRNEVDAVIMYDTSATECFEYLSHETRILKILDVTIGSRIYAKDLYCEEMQRTGDCSLKREYPDLWIDRIINKFQSEIDLADYAIAGSEYVKRTLIYSGMPEERILIVPYGTTPRTVDRPEIKKSSKLQILFVGQVNYRKGLHRLLPVIQSFHESEIHLKIVGSYDNKLNLYKEYSDDPRIEFLGSVPHEEIGKIYASSDVFVLPSLSEGLARVGIEALGCGLPVICTDHSGVNDLIVEGENGFVVPVCDDNALKKKIQWFIDNKQEIPRMSECAMATGKKYTWDAYYKNYHAAVRKIIEIERKKVNEEIHFNYKSLFACRRCGKSIDFPDQNTAEG